MNLETPQRNRTASESKNNKDGMCERKQATEHAQIGGAGSDRKARLNLAPPFHSLIMRLIHPVTYATILPCDLLLSQPDGEIEPKREGGVGDCLKAANQHACVIGPGLDSAVSGQCVSLFIKSAVWVKPRFIGRKQC